jgi:predicted PurR-regulated permease PerM
MIFQTSLIAFMYRVSLVLCVLGMIVGYHFWGAIGVLAAVALFIVCRFLAARWQSDLEEQEYLRDRRSREDLEPE